MKPLIIAALFAAPLAPIAPLATDSAPSASARSAHADPFGFPAPSQGLSIQAPAEEPLTIHQVVNAYGELTGQTMVYTDETQGFLAGTRLNMSGPLEVPADRVQTTFEALLAMHDFMLVPVTEESPRVIQVVSMQTAQRSMIRSRAIFVDAEHLDAAAQHPAVLCSTVVNLPNTDVRQLSNAMRTLVTDTNTQQIIPGGTTNSLVLVGTGQGVAQLAKMLHTIDAAGTPRVDGAGTPQGE